MKQPLTPEVIRDLALNWLRNHKEGCDEDDCLEPFGILSFLCHCLGLRADRLNELLPYIAEYERTCEGCQHLRN